MRDPNAHTYSKNRTDLQVARATARSELMRSEWSSSSASDLRAALALLLEFDQADATNAKLATRLRNALKPQASK